MDPLTLFRQLAISTLLGLLVGLQRERSDSELAGIRTFPLITLFGTMSAVFAVEGNQPWILPAGLLGLIGILILGNLHKLKQVEFDPGITTEIAVLLMYLIGAFVVIGPWIIAAALAGGVAILLHLKPLMHGFAKRMGDTDFRAIMQFVLITFIILPVLPNQNYDPFSKLQPMFVNVEFGKFDVLNPQEIWLMVVLVVGISLGGYVSYKLLGRRAGIVLGGILGGTISSTATTVSYSRRTKQVPEAAGMAVIVIMIASTIVYIRILLEIAIVAPSFVAVAGGPILVMMSVSGVLAVVTWLFSNGAENEMPTQGNPTELKSAIVFAIVYAVVLLGVAVGKFYLQDSGLYVIAAVSGMTDMDAITLSTSRLVKSNRLDPQIGWKLIIIATMSNLMFKGLIVAAIGHRDMLRKTSVLFGIAILSGAVVLLMWG